MHDELEEGALASAGSADDKHKFAFLNLQAYVFECHGAVFVRFRNVVELNHCTQSFLHIGRLLIKRAAKHRSVKKRGPAPHGRRLRDVAQNPQALFRGAAAPIPLHRDAHAC